MKGSDIRDLVIVKLEEQSIFLNDSDNGGPILSGGDSISQVKPIYDYIDKQLSVAADEILNIAPLNSIIPLRCDTDVYDIDGGLSNYVVKYYVSNGEIYIESFATDNNVPLQPIQNNDGTGRINVPVNFLRLYSLEMEGWHRAAHKAITKLDKEYTLQHNRYTMGTPQKPVAVYSGVRTLLDTQTDEGNLTDYIYRVKAVQIIDGGEIETPLTESVITALLYSEEFSGPNRDFIMTDVYGKSYWIRYNDEYYLREEITVPYLEYYSCTGNDHAIKELLFVPRFNNNNEYHNRIAEAIALNCAKKVLEVYGDADRTNIINAELTSVLQNMQL